MHRSVVAAVRARSRARTATTAARSAMLAEPALVRAAPAEEVKEEGKEDVDVQHPCKLCKGSASALVELQQGAGVKGKGAKTAGAATMRAWTHTALEEMSQPPRRPPMRYACDTSLLMTDLQARFVLLGRDAATDAFLETCGPSSVLTVAAFNVLRKFWSITDTNAWLGGGQMHVLSQAQVLRLLDWPQPQPPATPEEAAPPRRRLLDVGAGDGNVTRHLAPLFAEVVATEVSPGMVERLQERGYTAVKTFELTPDAVGTEPYDVVSLLNVLDRCDTPKTLLKQIRPLLRPGTGRLLVAVVLPFCPFVEDGSGQRPPTERLAVTSRRWEHAVNELVQRVCIPWGYTVVSVSRVPYYSQIYSAVDDPAFVTLDDAVLVLAPAATDDPLPTS